MQKINVTRFRPADYQRTVWFANAETGMIPEDLLDPAAWGLVAEQLQPFHRIEVIADCGEWWAEYLVVDATKVWAKVELLRKWARPDAALARDPQKAEYKVMNRGIKKWSVVRLGDNAVIRDGFPTREAAEEHLEAHQKAMAA